MFTHNIYLIYNEVNDYGGATCYIVSETKKVRPAPRQLFDQLTNV